MSTEAKAKCSKSVFAVSHIKTLLVINILAESKHELIFLLKSCPKRLGKRSAKGRHVSHGPQKG